VYFASIEEFIVMGGHGMFVWLAYGVTAVTVSVWLLVQKRRRSTLVAELRQSGRAVESGRCHNANSDCK